MTEAPNSKNIGIAGLKDGVGVRVVPARELELTAHYWLDRLVRLSLG